MSRCLSFKFYIKIQWSVCRSSLKCQDGYQYADLQFKLQLQVASFKVEFQLRHAICSSKVQDSHQNAAHRFRMQLQVSRFISRSSSKFQNSDPSHEMQVMTEPKVLDAISSFRIHIKIQHIFPSCSSKLQDSPSRSSCTFQHAVTSCKLRESHQDPVQRFKMQWPGFCFIQGLSFKFPDAAPRFKIRVQIQLSASRCS